MAPEQAPAFQFYPKDFLSDGNQGEMSLMEVGAYARLMCRCWLEMTIPDDPVRAANLAGSTPTQMRKMWPVIRRCFRPSPEQPGRLIHPRLEKERVKQAEYRRKQSEKGKASASARATGSQPDGNREATAVQPVNPWKRQPDPQPEGNSPVSDLRSGVPPPSASVRARAHTGAGAMGAGGLPRAHLRHVVCGRACLHETQFQGFIAKFGGESGAASDAVRTWAEGVADEWNTEPKRSQPIGGNDFQFWDARWMEWLPAARVTHSQKTAGNLTALQRFAERGQG